MTTLCSYSIYIYRHCCEHVRHAAAHETQCKFTP